MNQANQENPLQEIKRLEEVIAQYQKKYDQLVKQSPDRWWHDEHFDNQLRVLEAMISGGKKRLIELKTSLPKKR